VFYVLAVAACISLGVAQADDPAKKLGAFLGKWQAEGTRGTEKITSKLECRWSPQGLFLVCEQSITTAAGDHRQLTVYSYNAKDGAYTYVTIAEPGAKPTSGKVEIKGNVWTYPFSFESNGKTVQIRTTNEFTDARTEVYKSESSDDGGVTWKTVLQGAAHKVND
jgi:hypothetical protein